MMNHLAKRLILANGRKIKGKKKLLFDAVIKQLKFAGNELVIYFIMQDDEVEKLYKKYVNQNLAQIIIAGGDGFIHLALNQWQTCNIPIGIIPLGTCNLFAKECGYSKDSNEIVKIIESGSVKPFFCGRANQHLFATVAGCGIDSYVMHSINWQWKKWFGRAYLIAAMLRKLVFSRPMIRISINGQLSIEVSTLLIAKGRYYAGSFCFAPKASVFDKTLYALYYRRKTFFHELKLILALFMNRVNQKQEISIIPIESLEIVAGISHPLQLDGDVRLMTPVIFTLEPQPRLVCVKN